MTRSTMTFFLAAALAAGCDAPPPPRPRPERRPLPPISPRMRPPLDARAPDRQRPDRPRPPAPPDEGDGEDQAGSIDWSKLAGTWHEDNSQHHQPVRVFTDADPGPARFRQRYEINADGTARLRVLHRADRHTMIDCTWTRRGNVVTITGQDGEGKVRTHRLEVVGLDAHTLRVRNPKPAMTN